MTNEILGEILGVKIVIFFRNFLSVNYEYESKFGLVYSSSMGSSVTESKCISEASINPYELASRGKKWAEDIDSKNYYSISSYATRCHSPVRTVWAAKVLDREFISEENEYEAIFKALEFTYDTQKIYRIKTNLDLAQFYHYKIGSVYNYDMINGFKDICFCNINSKPLNKETTDSRSHLYTKDKTRLTIKNKDTVLKEINETNI